MSIWRFGYGCPTLRLGWGDDLDCFWRLSFFVFLFLLFSLRLSKSATSGYPKPKSGYLEVDLGCFQEGVV